MNKTLKQLSEEYYELLNLGEIDKDQYSLPEWILKQCPNKDIEITANLCGGVIDRLDYILSNMCNDDEISNCNATIESLIEDDVFEDTELCMTINGVKFVS